VFAIFALLALLAAEPPKELTPDEQQIIQLIQSVEEPDAGLWGKTRPDLAQRFVKEVREWPFGRLDVPDELLDSSSARNHKAARVNDVGIPWRHGMRTLSVTRPGFSQDGQRAIIGSQNDTGDALWSVEKVNGRWQNPKGIIGGVYWQPVLGGQLKTSH
jgi:hypothetical protein